jgi:hypothetical protein
LHLLTCAPTLHCPLRRHLLSPPTTESCTASAVRAWTGQRPAAQAVRAANHKSLPDAAWRPRVQGRSPGAAAPCPSPACGCWQPQRPALLLVCMGKAFHFRAVAAAVLPQPPALAASAYVALLQCTARPPLIQELVSFLQPRALCSWLLAARILPSPPPSTRTRHLCWSVLPVLCLFPCLSLCLNICRWTTAAHSLWAGQPLPHADWSMGWRHSPYHASWCILVTVRQSTVQVVPTCNASALADGGPLTQKSRPTFNIWSI